MDTPTKDQINEAMKLLHAAGYHVVRQEDVVTLASEKIVSLGDIYRYSGDPGFGKRIVKDILVGMSARLGAVAELATDDDIGVDGRRFRARVKCIAPGALWSDPYERELFAHMQDTR